MNCLVLFPALAVLSLTAASSYKQPSYGPPHQSYGHQTHGYQEKSYKKAKYCYQCAYSPPKTYYDKKVVLEKYQYGGYDKKHGHNEGGYGHQGGYEQSGQNYQGGYAKKTYVPVPRTINGGWDKCLGPFDHYTAKDYGVDVWDCHSNCYIRKDPNGDIFRGCYKGEYGVNPYKLGCHKQGGHGSVYCFCEGDKCNNGPAGH